MTRPVVKPGGSRRFKGTKVSQGGRPQHEPKYAGPAYHPRQAVPGTARPSGNVTELGHEGSRAHRGTATATELSSRLLTKLDGTNGHSAH